MYITLFTIKLVEIDDVVVKGHLMMIKNHFRWITGKWLSIRY